MAVLVETPILARGKVWDQGAWHAFLAADYIPRVGFEGSEADETFQRGIRGSSESKAGKYVDP